MGQWPLPTLVQIIACNEMKILQALEVKLKLAQVVCRKSSEELKPSLDVAKSN